MNKIESLWELFFVSLSLGGFLEWWDCFFNFCILVLILWVVIILYLEGLNLVVRLSFGGFFDGAWLYSKRFSLLKLFLSKLCGFGSWFWFFVGIKVAIVNPWSCDKIEVNYKCYWVKKHRRVADFKGGAKFSCSWRTSKQVLLVSALFWEVCFQTDLGGLWWLFGD